MATRTLITWPQYTAKQWFTRTCLQLLGVALIGAVVIAPALPVLYALGQILPQLGKFGTLALIPVAYVAYVMMLLTCVVVLKWVVIGKCRPGEYRLDSAYYIKWWFVDRLYTFVGDRVYGLGVIQLWYNKALGLRVSTVAAPSDGAKQRSRYFINLYTTSVSEFDLVSIGENTVVREDVKIRPAVLAGGLLVIKPVVIGSNCIIGVGSVSLCTDRCSQLL